MSSLLLAAAQTEAGAGYDGFIGWVLRLMEVFGELGVGMAVLIETFAPPVPSEALLPVAGFLAYEGRMNFIGAWVAASLGALVGAWLWYWIGAALGRDRTRRLVDRIPLMDGTDFDKAEAFFLRWGGAAVFFGRCVPLVRSFISIPAGIERMHFAKFSFYTLAGSLIWNGIWVGLGFAFGPAIKPILEEWSGIISYGVVGIIGLLLLWFVIVRVRKVLRQRRLAEDGSQG